MTILSNTFAFVRYGDLARSTARPSTASFVLVGARADAAAAVRAIRATGLEAFPKADFSEQEARIVADMSTELMQIMTFAAFLIGLAVTALTLYTATLSRLREVGVMKALGAGQGRLMRDVASQAAWTMGGALAIAVILVYGLARLVEGATSNVTMLVQPSSIVRAVLGAALLGLLGAAAPLVKVARVDPATVFRR
jgi:putative ABC transport system permease protein